MSLVLAVAAASVREVTGSAAAATNPGAVWLGGFETGDLRQWDYTWQGRDANAQFQLVTSPSRDGGLAGKFTVRPGDVYGNSSGERSELALVGSGENEGQRWYYGWSTLFPTGWTAPSGWGDIVQWHSDFPLPAALALNARGDTLNVDLYAGPTTVASRVTRTWTVLNGLNNGRWNDFVMSVKWSASDGAIQLWHRVAGESSYRRVLSVSGLPTLQYDGSHVSANYLKMGLYRNTDTGTNVIYHDSMRRVPSLLEALSAGPDPIGGAALTAMQGEDAAVSGTAATPPPPAPAPTPPPAPASVPSFFASDLESDPGSTFYNHGTGTFSWATDAAHSGTRSLKVVSGQGLNALARWMSYTGAIQAVAGTTYNASAWLKANSISQYGTLTVTFWDASGNYLGSTVDAPQTVNGNQDWTKLDLSATAPANTASLRVEFRLYGPGTLWADDIQVAASTPAAALPTAPAAVSAASSSVPAGFTGVVTDSGCTGCSVTTITNGLQATIQGGADTLDTAYALDDFGGTSGLSGRTYTRDLLALAPNQTLAANLAVFQLRDVSDTLVYELYLDSGRTLNLWSPAGGLQAASINSSTGVTVPNDGTTTLQVEVSALANNSVIVRINGTDRITLTGLSGASTGNQRYLRAGIDHYDTTTSGTVTTTAHTYVAISQTTWLGAPA